MLTKDNHKIYFLYFYIICFVAYYFFLYSNNITLSTFQPLFFYNELDVTTNSILYSNIHNVVIKSKNIKQILDYTLIALPFSLIYIVTYFPKLNTAFSIFISLFNVIYFTLLSVFTFTTSGQCIPWIIMPLIFCGNSNETFTALYNIFRWIFLAIFASAGLWKLTSGSLFNTEQMAGTLLLQHSQLISEGKQIIIQYLISDKYIAQFFYVAAFLVEIFFAIGFFTKKYDRYLAASLFVFLLMDYFLMEINYFSWTVFIGLFILSKYEKNYKSN